jgi:hypothetical protein
MAITDLHLRLDLSVRPGESDPARMLGRVLVLLAAVVSTAALALVWWLATPSRGEEAQNSIGCLSGVEVGSVDHVGGCAQPRERVRIIG